MMEFVPGLDELRACGRMTWVDEERAGEVTHHRGGVVADGHGHDVEATGRIPEALPLEVVLGEAHEALPLREGDGGAGRLAPPRVTALHLHEHPHAALAADEIDLTLGEPHVARDHGK